MKVLVRWSSPFVELLRPVLQARMQEIGGKFWAIGGWAPNENAFCAPNYGTGKTARYRKKKTKGLRRTKNEKNPAQPQAPQVWITLMWHMGLRLPWNWRLGPSNSSERGHVMDMVRDGDFPDRTLFCGDAGFIGYPLWSCILHGGFQFLVRVGANVSLLAESAEFQRQQNGLVLCWPKAMRQAGQPPLRLRLVKAPLGKTTAWLLTSVLDPDELTVRQMVRLYQMRWGVEVEFRGLKQTLNRAKLRCRNDRRLLAELDWSILAMAIAELFALKAQLSKQTRTKPDRTKSRKRPPSPDPAKRSLAGTMRALRHCLRHLDEVPAADDSLGARLRAAVTDSDQRKASKGARYRPPNPDKKPLGDPELRTMTAQERQKLESIAV